MVEMPGSFLSKKRSKVRTLLHSHGYDISHNASGVVSLNLIIEAFGRLWVMGIDHIGRYLIREIPEVA